MAFYTYTLHCNGGKFYVGHTDNLEHRIAQHQSGQIAGFTANHLPVAVVWSEGFATRVEARECEHRLKGWSRAKKMALIRGDWDSLSTHARSKGSASTSSARTVSVASAPPVPRTNS